ncbi:putative secondary metabolism biosynthetic enzyme [Tricholoma furcatifolium]|nr:putative secondary metabolism biosynthetic enzyme [Tricholoma furcatifolium]
MEAACFHAPHNLEIIKAPIPQITDDQVLIKVTCCGGEFLSNFPLIPGHEIVGTIASLGKSVTEFAIGDRVVVDPTVLVQLEIIGTRFGKKVYKIHNLTDEEATLVEPAACAIHGLDKLNAPVGVEVLVIGSGPTGLILAQLLKLNGASKVIIAANKGIKTKVAQELNCGDEYIELDRLNPEPQWAELKKAHPYGFDVVVEATGSEKVANEAINYVRRGGTLLIYGVYSNDARVHWPPSKIFGDEIRIIGSFAQTHCFPRAVAYLDSGKIRVQGMVTDVFAIKDYQKALDKMNSKDAVKVAVKPTL